MQTGGGYKSLIPRVSPLNSLNRFQSGFISFTFVVLHECEGLHCRTLRNFLITQSLSHLITCQKKRFFASAQNDEKLRRVNLLPRLGEADFCTDDAATLLVRLARIANVLSLWLKSEPVRAWKKSKTGWDGEWFISPNNSNVISIQSSFTSSGVYAPLHPAPAFQINDFSYCLRRVFQTGSLWRQSDANRYSALRSHINCKAQPKRVNSVLRTSDNTRLVIVSLTLMAHFVKSTQNQKLYIYPCSLHKSRGVNYTVVSLSGCNQIICQPEFISGSYQHGSIISIHSFISKRVSRISTPLFTPEVA